MWIEDPFAVVRVAEMNAGLQDDLDTLLIRCRGLRLRPAARSAGIIAAIAEVISADGNDTCAAGLRRSSVRLGTWPIADQP
jgi:hypothetical protein